VIVETQQQSDVTYRLYDYGRPRELHLKEGLRAVKEKVASGKVLRPSPSIMNGGGNRRAPLIAAPYFVVESFEMTQPHTFQTADGWGKTSAQILVAVEGCAVVEAQGLPPVTLAKGDAVAVPACVAEFSVCPQWRVEFLKSYVPGETLPEPATRR
jgi:mannose-6-phosphate isomerase